MISENNLTDVPAIALINVSEVFPSPFNILERVVLRKMKGHMKDNVFTNSSTMDSLKR